MPLTPSQCNRLARQLAIATLADLNLRQAARLLLEVADDYRHAPGDGARIGDDGTRWYAQRMDAVADAIWRGVLQPALVVRPWREAIPRPQQNADAWWGIPTFGGQADEVVLRTAGWHGHGG